MYSIIRGFTWESEAQEKGYLSLIQWMLKNASCFESVEFAIAAYFIQKDHESHEWWAETVGTQINLLTNEISVLRAELLELRRNELPKNESRG